MVPEIVPVVAVVTSMGRRRHLGRTLPLLLSSTRFSVVVVDWSCPEGSGDLAESLGDPRVSVVRRPGEVLFNLSAARNLGARSVSLPGDPVLAFLDADQLVPPGSVLPRLAHTLPPRAAASQPWFGGLLLVRRSLFEESGGYDESFEGWAPEDVEMRVRLHLMGASHVEVPRSASSTIHHGDDLRGAHYSLPKAESARRGRALLDRRLRERFGVSFADFASSPEGLMVCGHAPPGTPEEARRFARLVRDGFFAAGM